MGSKPSTSHFGDATKPLVFQTAKQYWQQRYLNGGTSGAGSYGRLGDYKAEILNEFYRESAVASVVEFGSGDGNLLSLTNPPQYLGVDVSDEAVAMCRAKFAGDSLKRFVTLNEFMANGVTTRAFDAALSLDVVYHLIEEDVYHQYIRLLFDSAQRFVVVYSSNVDRQAKSPHVRHRCFTDWVDANRPDWALNKTLKNKFPVTPGVEDDQHSFADFYFYSRNVPARS